MHYMQSTRERREHFSLPLGFGRAESPKRLAIVHNTLTPFKYLHTLDIKD